MGQFQHSANLISDLRVIVVMSQVSKDVIWVLAVQVAKTSIDPHDFPGKLSSIWTLEPHFNSLGLVGCAAPVVCADATIFGSIQTFTHTS